VLALATLVLCLSLGACGRSEYALNSDGHHSHYERSSGNSRVIVFVHGIFGNSVDTWKCPSGAYWPKLIVGDDDFSQSDVYVVAYDTPFFGNQMSIDEVVANIDNRLVADKLFSSHKEVLLVAHSLGGLVIQQLLLTHRDYAKQVPFIYFYATPETGAQIARLGYAFSADPLLKQMFSGDENYYLLNLENQWREANFHIIRYCAYEKLPMNGSLVVDRLSGTRYCDGVVPINQDHVGIAKPCSPAADSYIALKNAYLSLLSREQAHGSQPDRPPTTHTQPTTSTPPAVSKPATVLLIFDRGACEVVSVSELNTTIPMLDSTPNSVTLLLQPGMHKLAITTKDGSRRLQPILIEGNHTQETLTISCEP
jgi:pimeloyl-ACP methyl ester carboxylesterase